MKKQIITVSLITSLALPPSAYSLSIGGGGIGGELTSCTKKTCTQSEIETLPQIDADYMGCSESAYTCYTRTPDNTIYLASNCTRCKAGYQPLEQEISECCGNYIAGSCPHKYTNCVKTCDQGTYASGNNCNRCPKLGGVYGTTTGRGKTSITECYMPNGTTINDSTGTFKFTGNCYYQKI